MKRFSASSAAQLMACPGSANLELSIPGFVEPERDEDAGRKAVGRDMHQVLEKAAKFKPKDMAGLAAAMLYVAELRQTRRFKILTEETVVADWLPSKPNTTADVVLYVQDELHIVDYKTGKIAVDAVENEQLMFYAMCYQHLAPRATGVTLHIVQPFSSEGNSVWFVSAARLAQFANDAIKTDEKILALDTTLGPSDHCTFCPANPHSRGDKGRPFCPVMMNLLYPKVDLDEDEILNL